MRCVHLPILGVLLLTAACRKTTPTITALDGTYSGTFQRQQGVVGQVSQVSLVFSGNHWTGTSQYPHYPGLCNGTYTISGNKITFINNCFWTADFDWSLILGKEYDLSVNGNAIEITRFGATYLDAYRLSK